MMRFRYRILDGPDSLIVQRCRGVCLEYAAGGRSVGQSATIGFSAKLDYSPRIPPTCSAYLLGSRALLNDTFGWATGVLRVRGNAVCWKAIRDHRARA